MRVYEAKATATVIPPTTDKITRMCKIYRGMVMRRTFPRWLEATNRVYVCRFISELRRSQNAQDQCNEPPKQLSLTLANRKRKALDRESWSESIASLEKTLCRVNQILTASSSAVNLCEGPKNVQLSPGTFPKPIRAQVNTSTKSGRRMVTITAQSILPLRV